MDHEYAIEQKQAAVTFMFKTVASSRHLVRRQDIPSRKYGPNVTAVVLAIRMERRRGFLRRRRRLCNRLLLLLHGGAAILARTHPPPLLFWHEVGCEGDPVVHVGDSGEVGRQQATGNQKPTTFGRE